MDKGLINFVPGDEGEEFLMLYIICRLSTCTLAESTARSSGCPHPPILGHPFSLCSDHILLQWLHHLKESILFSTVHAWIQKMFFHVAEGAKYQILIHLFQVNPHIQINLE